MGGFLSGPYQAGRSTVAERCSPELLRYWIVNVRISPPAWTPVSTRDEATETAASAAAATAARLPIKRRLLLVVSVLNIA